MKTRLLFFLSFVLLFSSFLNSKPSSSRSVVLEKMAAKLEKMKSIRFHSETELTYKSDNYHSTFATDQYVEFNQGDKRSVDRFQIEYEGSLDIYSGTEYFILFKKEKTYQFQKSHGEGGFENLAAFINSIPTLRSSIEEVIKNDSIIKTEGDTLIENATYKTVSFGMHKNALAYMNNAGNFTKDITIYYKILVDPKTDLPFQVIQGDLKKDFNRTVFSKIVENPASPEAASWSFASYQNAYKPKPKAEIKPLITAGADLPDFTLPEYSNQRGLILKKVDLKGKIVMIDFWFKSCGACMESWPHLQTIQKKYGRSGFQLVSINIKDPESDIKFFYDREKPAYKMLYQGQHFAKQLGVPACPTIILVDGTGKVIYSHIGFEETKLRDEIDTALKKQHI